MSSLRKRTAAVIACFALVLVAVVAAGCGSESSGESGEGPAEATKSNSGYVDWPMFGRVPERTHYLPAESKLLDPPLKQDWSINTHALI
ncbi:MAG TPA: hypothetical protein VHB23_16780, partial [Devosiaceae bacterium]|nr:hypothetical protein [Devosiaceae bacterium]